MELLTALSKLFLRIELWCLWQFKRATSVPNTYSVALYFELRSGGGNYLRCLNFRTCLTQLKATIRSPISPLLFIERQRR
jgi:hypothetical protein